MADWTLYVDESGHDDWLVVAGVLLRERESHELNRSLRAALAGVSPLSPWPLHGTDLRLSGMRLVWAARAGGSEDAAACALRAICQPLLEALAAGVQQVPPPKWGAAWQATLKTGAPPPREDVVAAEGWLRRCQPRQMAVLDGAVRQETEQLRELLDAWSDRMQLIVAAGRITGNAEGELQGLQRDDYVRVLQAMFERAVAMIGGEEPRRVWYRVATRGVQQRGVPRMELRHWQVGHVAAAARQGMPGVSGLRLLPMDGIERYDANTVPGLVLADIAANAIRWPIKQGGDLGVLRQRVRAQTVIGGWNLQWPVPRLGRTLPAIAAEGEAGRLIRSSCPPSSPAACAAARAGAAALRPTWIGDQATAWISALEAV